MARRGTTVFDLLCGAPPVGIQVRIFLIPSRPSTFRESDLSDDYPGTIWDFTLDELNHTGLLNFEKSESDAEMLEFDSPFHSVEYQIRYY